MITNVGDRIRELRTAKKLSLDELSVLINKRFDSNINKGMISKWENNKEMPTSENMFRLTEIFNCDLSYLMGFDEKLNDNNGSVAELVDYINNNKKKLSSINKEDSQKLIKLIDAFID